MNPPEAGSDGAEHRVIDETTHTPMQLYRMEAVYNFIARLIPTEGRDYTVEFTFPEDGGDNVSVKLEPHTPFGKIWCDYCREALRSASTRKTKTQ